MWFPSSVAKIVHGAICTAPIIVLPITLARSKTKAMGSAKTTARDFRGHRSATLVLLPEGNLPAVITSVARIHLRT